jgi:DNA repair protein RadD
MDLDNLTSTNVALVKQSHLMDIFGNMQNSNIKCFDYPELDTVVMARPTMSLAMYYQIVGRCIRPYKGKTAWFVDLCGNINRFGEVSDLHLKDTGNGKWAVFSKGRQLTNVRF